MNTKVKVIFAPGNGGGKTDENFFPYLKYELGKLGCQVIAAVWPDPELARRSFWIPFLESLGADSNTIIIGHSSGAIAAMKYAETHKLFGSILISPYASDLGLESEKVSGYFDDQWQWNSIKNNQKFIIQFSSPSDPHIPIEESRAVAKFLDAEYHELEDRGHFYPLEEFPEVVEALKKHL